MHKILNTIILTTLLILGSAVTGSASWQLTLDVSTPDSNSDTGIASNKLTIGTEQSATDTYDNAFDTVALLKGPIQAYLVHPEYAAEQQKLWRDLRSDALPNEWTIEVDSLGETNTINIKWGLNAPDNLNFTLIDQDSNKEVGMRASSEYSYNGTPNSQKKFLLRVSENATVSTSGGGNGISGNNSSSTGPKGGGCGYIKNIGGNGYPGSSGSAALNMVILFTPLIWLTIRRVAFLGVMVYVIKGRKEIYRRHYEEKYYPWSNLPASFSSGNFDTKQLWEWWRGGQQYPGRRFRYSNPFLGCTND